MNRLEHHLNPQPPPEESAGDYWLLYGEFGSFHLRPDEGARVARLLDRRWTPRWLVFRDVVGSRTRVRSAHVRLLVEMTAGQRAANRVHNGLVESEERHDDWGPGTVA